VEPALEIAIRLGVPLLLLLCTYFIGSAVEAAHFRSLRLRELRTRSFPLATLESAPAGWEISEVTLVTGSAVVSLDYFKRFLAGLRGIVGGHLASYESLLDRARREALLRMKQAALERGFHGVVNVRLETSRVASARSNGKGTAGVEVLAFGTALRRVR